MSERLRDEPSAADAVLTASELRAGIDLIALLQHVHQQALSHIEHEMAEFDLSFTQWSTLWLSREGHADTMGDVVRLLRLSSGAITRLIDSPESRHPLQRNQSNSDSRVIHLSLMPQGDRLVASSSFAIERAWRTLPSPFQVSEGCEFRSPSADRSTTGEVCDRFIGG